MSTLIFTIAQNGYDVAYGRCLESHRAYADDLGATYVAVTEPKRQPDTAVSAWLKVPLLLDAIRSGYSRVAFIDADAEVKPGTPNFDSSFTAGRPLGMALGRSGRLNSGVIFARQSPETVSFLERVMSSMLEEIPDEARAHLKYENGNVIYVDSLLGGVERIDLIWNNTWDPRLDDHIRHYTGPLRATYRRGLAQELRYRLARAGVNKPSAQPPTRSVDFADRLLQATMASQERYPELLAGRVPQSSV